MRARRSQRDQAIAGGDAAAVDHAILFDDADTKPGEIEISRLVHARHFRGFAANQRATGQAAALGNAADYAFRLGQFEFTGGVVVEEKQRLGAQHGDIVGAHRHQVDADAVEFVEIDREFQLGADAVGAGHQQRLPITLQRQFEQSAEAANAADTAIPSGGFDRRLDAFHQFIAGIDIDTGGTIIQRSFGIHGLLVQVLNLVCYFTRLEFKCPCQEKINT